MANCFIISYDLCSSSRDYNQLYSAIKSYGTWGRLMESTHNSSSLFVSRICCGNRQAHFNLFIGFVPENR